MRKDKIISLDGLCLIVIVLLLGVSLLILLTILR